MAYVCRVWVDFAGQGAVPLLIRRFTIRWRLQDSLRGRRIAGFRTLLYQRHKLAFRE